MLPYICCFFIQNDVDWLADALMSLNPLCGNEGSNVFRNVNKDNLEVEEDDFEQDDDESLTGTDN